MGTVSCNGQFVDQATARVSAFDAGLRPLERTTQQRIENPLASRLLSGDFAEGDAILVDYKGKSFTFEQARARAANR